MAFTNIDGLSILDNKLIGYSGSEGSVTIPDFVTEIFPAVFKDCKSLINITLPNSVKCISPLLFAGCESLKSVKLFSGLTEIHPSAFRDCKSLTNIDIPNSVTQIYGDAFNGCTSLRYVTIPDSVTRIGHHTFEACWSLEYNEYDNALYLGNEINPFYALIKPKDPSITTCIIHTDTKIIAEKAFADCKLLTSVIISDGVTNISDYAFAGCLNLRQITIPDSVTSIGKNAFDLCVDLAFGCIEYDNALYLGNKGNPYHTLLEGVDDDITDCKIHNDTKVIYGGAFSDCHLLTNVSVPVTVTNIGENAFPASVKPKYYSLSVTSDDSDKYVFISYSSRNQDLAESMRHLLNEESIRTWMAPYDIPSGSKYAYVLNDAIKNSACVLLLLTEQSQASEHVDREMERAVSYKKPIVSMHLDNSQLNSGFSYYLGNHHIEAVKTIDRNDSNIQKILLSIRSFME